MRKYLPKEIKNIKNSQKLWLYVGSKIDKLIHKYQLNNQAKKEIKMLLELHINHYFTNSLSFSFSVWSNGFLINLNKKKRLEKINTNLFTFGKRLADLLYLRYYEFGLDTPQKRKLYEPFMNEVIDLIHFACLKEMLFDEKYAKKLLKKGKITITYPIGVEK